MTRPSTGDWLIGSYGPELEGTGRGIYGGSTLESGAFGAIELLAEAQSPSFLIQRSDRLYAAIEGGGAVESYAIDGGRLLRDGSAASGGVWPCHIAFAGSAGRPGDVIVAANFSSGSFGVVPLDAVGRVTGLAQTVYDEGSGPRPLQDGPHAHATFLLDDSTLLGLDLGADRLEVFSVDSDDGQLMRTSSIAVPPGTGPRDIARHPSGLLYVLGQLSHELLVFRQQGSTLESVSSTALPGAVEGDHSAAISFGPGGFVYVGLRGSDRIAVLTSGADGSAMDAVGWVSSEGAWPRHHAIDGDVLQVANQGSDAVASFRLGGDGIPRLIADPVAVPSPAFLLKRPA